ncbi:VPLPA-CTERM sorting domain-containing protein [Sulfitobacter sp. JBTF-M27]|uniref:VPLPA-CTERM sorting domain-containing protein n=1 Tax=Sulfitobacter sediminilitoris TaxID=2698830 RepID=A0A6P0CC60_9RHOB|nr:VPLPA-CTERM sorting domain-containing protein [Sulfitobacter sediminilitoris]NEK23779.1 VPLPA-CTERM sorting domain-containing protein [Sulfitobacter sediminilitoris]
MTQTMFDYTGRSFLGTISVGATFDFLSYDPLGISMLTIFGIDVAEMVDPTDPFVVGMTFVSGGFQSTLSIDAITVNTRPTGPVPLPAALQLLLVTLGGLGLAARRRKVA